MDSIHTIVMIAAGLLIVVLGWPMAAARVRPNFWYGYRTQGSLASTDIWYATNRIAGRWFMIVGAFVIATAVSLHLLAAKPSVVSLGSVGVLVVGVVAAGLRAFLEERKMMAKRQS